MPVTLELPWPPSVNHYWRHAGRMVLISKEGRSFRKNVEAAVFIAGLGGLKPFAGEVEISILAYPPDRRARDIDNLLKSLLDSIQYTGLLVDDNQVGKLAISREAVCQGGKVVVTITERQQEAA